MRSLATRVTGRCWLVAALAVWLPGADAAADEDFYKGKTVTFIVGTAVGGGYDTYSRLVAAHIGPHLGGRPVVVAQNMPGAAGIRAANYLYSLAPKDGATIGMVDEAIYLNQILGTQELRFDATKFNWIGRVLANSAVLFARREASVQKIEDAFNKELIVSSTGTASRLNWTVLKKVLGLKLTLISGYQGSNDSLLALTRGEVDALSMPWSILRINGEHLIRNHEINLLLQTGAEKAAGLSDVPRMIDLARNDDERRLLELFSSPSSIGRSVLAPPGLPAERVDELRRAFTATMQDASFLADLDRARLDHNPLPGEELQKIITGAGDLPPSLIQRARRIADTTAD
ncbi:MAG TPA: tripartite tricarboxylate transporter substrate-binding protein [Xanthobacteraceae bacterium]